MQKVNHQNVVLVSNDQEENYPTKSKIGHLSQHGGVIPDLFDLCCLCNVNQISLAVQ